MSDVDTKVVEAASDEQAAEPIASTEEVVEQAEETISEDASAADVALDLNPTAESDDVEAAEDEEDFDSEDSLTFSNGVIEKIVAIAMRDVPGVVGMKGGFLNRIQDAFGATDARKGVTVEVTPDSSVRVNVSVLIEYGVYAPQVFEDVKRAVVKQVTGMTGLTIAGVNLRIEDVLTPEEIASRRESQLARLDEAPQAESDEGEEADSVETE